MARKHGSRNPFSRSRQSRIQETPPKAPPPSTRVESSIGLSKAEKLLGETGLNRPSSSHVERRFEHTAPVQMVRSLHSKPSLLQVDMSEPVPQIEWDYAQEMVEEMGQAFQKGVLRPQLHARASSNLLGPENGEQDDDSSVRSVGTRRIYRQQSNSTLQSYYDSSKNPPFITQQTSASAIRDNALRKGCRPISEVTEHSEDPRAPSLRSQPQSPGLEREPELDARKEKGGKRKPARLDLSKLFPKHKPLSNGHLLSPDKLFHSPVRVNTPSEYQADYFQPALQSPRSIASALSSHPIDPPPRGSSRDFSSSRAKSKKPKQAATVPLPNDPRQRSLKQDPIMDNAKVNVRRPPKGIQNWFDGFLESDSSDGEKKSEIQHAPQATLQIPVAAGTDKRLMRGSFVPTESSRKARRGSAASSSHLSADAARKSSVASSSQLSPVSLTHRLPGRAYADNSSVPADSESIYSVQSRASKFSDLKTRSVMSFSDSDDDGVSPAGLPIVRDSVAAQDTDEDIIIGKAHAYDIKARPISQARAPAHGQWPVNSNRQQPLMSPDPVVRDFAIGHTKQTGSLQVGNATRSHTQRSGHTRQPSMIPEDDGRARTTSPSLVDQNRARHDSPAASLQSSYTGSPQSSRSGSRSKARKEPPTLRLEPASHKMMAVTAEEEALLEMMRRKRAAMAKQNFTEGYKTALQLSEGRGTEESNHNLRATRALEPPLPSPPLPSPGMGNLLDSFPAPSNTPPARGSSYYSDTSSINRLSQKTIDTSKPGNQSQTISVSSPYLQSPTNATYLQSPTNATNTYSSTSTTPRQETSPYPPQHGERSNYSAYDAIRHLTDEPLSPASRPTTSPSPLPSPVTPRHPNEDMIIKVKVATSEPSTAGSITDTTADSSSAIVEDTRKIDELRPRNGRRRTASSGAEIVMGLDDDLARSARSSINTALNMSTSHLSSNRSSLAMPIMKSSEALSVSSKTSKKQSNKAEKRVEAGAGVEEKPRIPQKSLRRPKEKRQERKEVSSVSEDILAAWGSLGGGRELEKRGFY